MYHLYPEKLSIEQKSQMKKLILETVGVECPVCWSFYQESNPKLFVCVCQRTMCLQCVNQLKELDGQATCADFKQLMNKDWIRPDRMQRAICRQIGQQTYQFCQPQIQKSLSMFDHSSRRLRYQILKQARIEQLVEYLQKQVERALEFQQETDNWIDLGIFEGRYLTHENKPVLRMLEDMGHDAREVSCYDLLFMCFSRCFGNQHNEWLSEMTERYPQSPHLMLGRAHIQYRLQNFEQALSLYQESQEIVPNCLIAWQGIAWSTFQMHFVNHKNIEMEQIRTILKKYSQEYWAKLILASLSIESQQQFESLIQEFPFQAQAFYKLGMLAFSCQQYESAIKYFLKVCRINPFNSWAYFKLGEVYNELDDARQAFKYHSIFVQRANRKVIKSATSHQAIGYYYFSIEEDYEKALHHYQQSYSHCPRQEIVPWIIVCLSRLQQSQQAIEWGNRLPQQSEDPNVQTARNQLLVCYARVGRCIGALGIWRKRTGAKRRLGIAEYP